MISIRSKQTKKRDCLCKRDFGLIPYKFICLWYVICYMFYADGMQVPNNYILSFELIFPRSVLTFSYMIILRK